MKKKPFKPLLVHYVNVGNEDVKMLGKKPSGSRTLFLEKENNVAFEQYIEICKNDFKKQAPETYENCEHIFFPTRENRNHIERVCIQENLNKKSCFVIECNKTTEKQNSEEYIRNFRKTLIDNLNNALDYFEFFITESFYPNSGGAYFSCIHFNTKEETPILKIDA